MPSISRCGRFKVNGRRSRKKTRIARPVRAGAILSPMLRLAGWMDTRCRATVQIGHLFVIENDRCQKWQRCKNANFGFALILMWVSCEGATYCPMLTHEISLLRFSRHVGKTLFANSRIFGRACFGFWLIGSADLLPLPRHVGNELSNRFVQNPF